MKLFKKCLLLVPALFILLMCAPIDSYAQVNDFDFVTCRNVPFNITRHSAKEQTYTFSIKDGPNLQSQLISSSSVTLDGLSIYRKVYRITIAEPGEYTILSVGSASTTPSEFTVQINNHDFSSEWTVDTEPTCTVCGSRSHHCTICNSKTGSESIPATGHTFSSWKTSKNATIFKAGQQIRKCTSCSKTEYKTIPKLKSSVKLKKSQVTLKVGKTTSLKIKSKSKGDSISSWSSSNKKVVTVNRTSGKIKGIKKGTAYITLKMKSGCNAKCKVKVK